MAISINVHKTLPGFRLSVAFETGADLVVVHGPSGAGKSLTLRLMAGLSRPDAGRVVVNGKTLFDSDAGIDVPLRHRNIGYVFQDYALFPHLSVRENVGFGMPRKLFGGPAPTDRLRIENLLENFGLAGISDLPVADISGGQQQRVALARALAPQPAVLLLDEPFSALDQPLRRQMRAEVKALQRQFGIPLLVVTHDIADVEALADEVIVVRDGRVDRTWSLRNICRRKKVARFVSDHGVPSVSGKGGNNHEF